MKRLTPGDNPFAYFGDIRKNSARCSHVVPAKALSSDLSKGRLPRFAWITPDLCHDTHDCSVATGDGFLAGLVPKLQRAMGPDGVRFLTWDEGASDRGCCRYAGGGHVLTIVAGPGARLHASRPHASRRPPHFAVRCSRGRRHHGP